MKKKYIVIVLSLSLVSAGLLSASAGASTTDAQTTTNFASIDREEFVEPAAIPAVAAAAARLAATPAVRAAASTVASAAVGWAVGKGLDRIFGFSNPAPHIQESDILFDN
ncbi:hypothetical protein NLX71_08065 [Paenibacillus sp. MZ04-78.2]|uniref:hypothetical protein n=1 Tax=Paenibacillus sp. MZ04-78.2 TaxID=2962034 RepID=UPI0020B669ED|nr:hypothetical protein [Paenibacillus sp. MZ04-78.2]MCP3773271.1 hypothetical protein [Paenibacillus sp. MZ04-78.2]